MKMYLDFLVIGAQKAGTTSLFKYLENHPQVYMPPEKEAHFFTKEERYQEGLGLYLEQYYRGVPENLKWGKISPQYLIDSRAPGRIAGLIPKVRLIAILRNPIDRALSHYKMMVRWQQERRSIETVFDELLNPQLLAKARELTFSPAGETSGYIVWGEYVRLLERFAKRFPLDQIKILFFEDLFANPKAVLRETFTFIGVDCDYTPSNLGAIYHRGGTRYRIPILSSRGVKKIFHNIPGRWGPKTYFWLDMWNIYPEANEVLGLSYLSREKLREYYRPEVENLEALLGIQVPWTEFHG